MSIEVLVLFNLTLLAAIASPGPAFLFSIKTSISSGRKAGIQVGIGLAMAAAFWTGMALLGLHGVLEIFPWTYWIIKTLGALYLAYIAYCMWRDARKSFENEGEVSRFAHIRNGILLNLSNPKSVLFAASVLIVIFPPTLSVSEKLLIVANHFIVELICYSLMAILFSGKVVVSKYLGLKHIFDRTASVVMGGLATRLLLEK